MTLDSDYVAGFKDGEKMILDRALEAVDDIEGEFDGMDYVVEEGEENAAQAAANDIFRNMRERIRNLI